MTKAFDQFMLQMNSTRLQRLSGFTRDQFKGLTESERLKVGAILETSAKNGNLVDINALGALGTAGARSSLLSILSHSKPDTEERVETLSALLSIEHDDQHLEQLCRALRSRSTKVRCWAVAALRYISPCSKILGEYLTLLDRKKDSAIRSIAARGILHHHGLLTNPQDPGLEYLPLARALVGTNKKSRSEALRKL